MLAILGVEELTVGVGDDGVSLCMSVFLHGVAVVVLDFLHLLPFLTFVSTMLLKPISESCI